MNTYYFFLDLTNQGRTGKFTRVVTCKDPNEDGLLMFVDDINKDGRFLPIEDDVTYKKL